MIKHHDHESLSCMKKVSVLRLLLEFIHFDIDTFRKPLLPTAASSMVFTAVRGGSYLMNRYDEITTKRHQRPKKLMNK